MSKKRFKIEAFLFTLGICGAIAGVILMVLGNWEGIFGLLSGAFVAYYGFKTSKASKNV